MRRGTRAVGFLDSGRTRIASQNAAKKMEHTATQQINPRASTVVFHGGCASVLAAYHGKGPVAELRM
jgi:hypothetical protein